MKVIKLRKIIIVLCWFVQSFYAQAEVKPCQLPFRLSGYSLFAKVSGMDYKTDLNTMSFRQLYFFDKRLNNKSLISGEVYTVFYTYRRLSNDIAFIQVYKNPELTILLYRDVLFCETDLVGRLIFTPNMKIPFEDFNQKQLTANYILKKGFIPK